MRTGRSHSTLNDMAGLECSRTVKPLTMQDWGFPVAVRHHDCILAWAATWVPGRAY